MENDESMLCWTLWMLDWHVIALLHATSSSSLIIECVTCIRVPLQLERLQANDKRQGIYTGSKGNKLLHGWCWHTNSAIPWAGEEYFMRKFLFFRDRSYKNAITINIYTSRQRGAICSYKNPWRVMFPFIDPLSWEYRDAMNIWWCLLGRRPCCRLSISTRWLEGAMLYGGHQLIPPECRP